MQFKNWLLGKADFSSTSSHIGLTVLRIFTGLSLAFAHGINKLPPSDGFISSVGALGFPVPILFAWLAACTEFFGGLLLAMGLFTRPAGIFIALTMMVGAFMRHADDPFSSKEKALLFLFIAILFVFVGSGKYAVDSLWQRKAEYGK